MIDPKTLHIGSHVMVNGVRVRVTAIESHLTGTVLGYCATIDGDKFTCGSLSINDGVEPIPITAELLTELGFLKMEEHCSVSVWMRRDIRIDFYGTRITAMVGNDYNKCKINPIYYLHELEAFLCLTTKTELIKE